LTRAESRFFIAEWFRRDAGSWSGILMRTGAIVVERQAARGRSPFTWLMALVVGAPVFLAGHPAFALSEIQREELPGPSSSGESGKDEPNPGLTVPLPDPIRNPSAEEQGRREDAPGQLARPETDPDGPLPEIIYNLDRLPEPVRRMHGLIVEAAKSGNIEQLRPLIGLGEDGTQLSFGGTEEDPIAFLKSLSGDDEGQEILAILEEVLSAGYVRLEPGAANELYVWPYFFAIPLDKLDARQRVELFKIVTAGDYEDMKAFGAYIFYRVGITPEGRWAFFVAGD
jgi:hypothetical protein